ncbi:hypothetical protein [Paraburkholderia lacunae]|nr:hypothetical protein [Paraburkholderia lacunae]
MSRLLDLGETAELAARLIRAVRLRLEAVLGISATGIGQRKLAG